jgi:acyl-CoA synthetase (NDP forming)
MPALTQDQKLEGVRALLNPRSVAIVGASDRPGNWSMRVFQTLRRFAFPGPIYR